VKQSDIIAVFNDSFELSRAVERDLVNDALKADLTEAATGSRFSGTAPADVRMGAGGCQQIGLEAAYPAERDRTRAAVCGQLPCRP